MKKKNESNIQDPWDNIKCVNLHIIGVPEREEKRREERGSKTYLIKLWLKT